MCFFLFAVKQLIRSHLRQNFIYCAQVMLSVISIFSVIFLVSSVILQCTTRIRNNFGKSGVPGISVSYQLHFSLGINFPSNHHISKFAEHFEISFIFWISRQPLLQKFTMASSHYTSSHYNAFK